MSDIPDFTNVKALSFDVYGTLIDWESGIISGLQPVLRQLPADHAWNKDPQVALGRLTHYSHRYWAEQPRLAYNLNLAQSLRDVAAEAHVSVTDDEAAQLGAGPGQWTAFADTVAGLQKLKQHYKLLILSNVDNANIQRAVAGALSPVVFDGVYTAENIGSYKPARANFEYLFKHAKELGVDKDKGELLHVAHGLDSDHEAVKGLGLRSVWIARPRDEEDKQLDEFRELVAQDKVATEWHVNTIGEFAEEVDRQFAAKK